MLYKTGLDFYMEHAFNFYSDLGEDGIIDQLFKVFNFTDGYVCEFGSNDGIVAINTLNLFAIFVSLFF